MDEAATPFALPPSQTVIGRIAPSKSRPAVIAFSRPIDSATPMPPKRAAKTAAKPRPAAVKKAPATGSTRSRAQKDTPPQEEAQDDSSVRQSTRTRKTRSSDQNAPAASDEAPPSDVPAPAPRTIQRPLTRGRPPRTVKKVAPSQVNKQTMDAIKKRMENDRRATKAGVVPQSAPETQEEQAERAIREAERHGGDAGLVPARPAAVPRSPSPVRPAMPGTAVKAPATVTRPQSAVKMQSTPGAETSVLALQNFRRRPRQPSLLQMVQNPELAADADETTDFTLGMSDDEEDEFAPHDESTPLQVAKAKQLAAEGEREQQEEVEPEAAQGRVQTPPPAVEDDDDDLYGATPVHQRQNRKRKSDALEDESEIQVHRSSPSLPRSPSLASVQAEQYDLIPATAPEDDAEEAATTESQQRRLLSDTYADPLSSSPPPDPISPASPEQPISRPAPVSPSVVRKSARANTTKQPKPLTTAALRAMLPKRRSARKNDYDFPSSSSSQDAHSSDVGQAARKSRPRKPPLKNTAGRGPAAARKAALATSAPAKKATSRTYARANNEDQPITLESGSSELSELNSDDVEAADETADTSISTVQGDKDVSDELKKAREKFADVDQWEMEFESASLGAGGNSSPWR